MPKIPVPNLVRRLIAGRYRVLGEIGVGGMGTVYRARDRVSGKVVALKILHPYLRREAAYIERFRKEARIARTLDSRHLVRILDFGEDRGAPYLVMEHVEGTDLAQRIAAGPMPLEEALTIGVQVALALEEAHSKGVVHRDVKPSNIMVDREGQALVADFGIARSEELPSQTGTGELWGAVHYMAPERFDGKSDARSDIYALGVVLYEMLSGRRPFDGTEKFEVIRQIMDADAPAVSEVRADLPPAVCSLVTSCLAKAPEERPKDALEVRRALESVLSEVSPEGAASVAPARRRRRIPRLLPRPTAFAAISLAIVVAAVLAVGAYLAFGGEDGVTAAAVTTEDVSLREGPGVSFAEAGLLPGGTRLQLLGRDEGGAWLRVRAVGGSPEGWLPATAVRDARGLIEGLAVLATATPETSCALGVDTPLGLLNGDCARMPSRFDPTCARGYACGVVDGALRVNDRTIAFINAEGDLAVAREDGSEVVVLTDHHEAQQPAWSPDGSYLAYVRLHLLPSTPAGAPARFESELRVIELADGNGAERNERLLVASSEAAETPDLARRRISNPAWGADRRTLYFEWAQYGSPGSERVFAVEAMRFGRVDFSEKPEPAKGVYVPALSLMDLRPRDFGVPDGYLRSPAISQSGEIAIAVCEPGQPERCGLGFWNGTTPRLVSPLAEASLRGPRAVGFDLYALLMDSEAAGSLLRVNAQGEKDLKPVVFAGAVDGAFAVGPGGSRLLMHAADGLALYRPFEAGRPWSPGHSPAWFAGNDPPARIQELRPVPYVAPQVTTPAPSVTPAPGRTPPAGSVDLSVTMAAGGCADGGEIVVHVKNVGAASVAPGTLFFRVQNFDSFTLLGPIAIERGLAPGEETVVQTGYTYAGVGVVVEVDPLNILRDEDRSNNRISCPPR